ncbi:E3 SUMO-protein ligase RanBP2-like [Asterias rubens]|uniref:E3 SUMO-protein ligase RanBP2-like n=1 Tax=Asterias rubens TaxID=7604 RepID=UPI00145523BB|nr:E3 SUMO-protein ligase RanBP2-like [Asterias rubens]
MSQTNRKKFEADKLLESVRQKARDNPREIQLKGFHIASAFVQAQEYGTALQHAQNYISIKPSDGRAHRLLGEIHEALKNVQKAIESYRRSLELNKTQKDLVLKVAELYCRVEFEPDRHRYWAERAEKLFPGHPKIYNIMEYIYRKSGKLAEFKMYLRQKLKSNPNDLKLNLQLLKVLTILGKLKEAQELCLQVEGARLFDHETQWWEQTVELYQMLLGNVNEAEPSNHHIGTFSHLLISLNKLVTISLDTPATRVDHSAMILKQMDVEMLRASDYILASQQSQEQELAVNVIQELKAQLYTHLATLITKMAATSVARWSDVVGMVTACYLVSAHIPPCRESTTTSTTRGQKGSLNGRLFSMSQCRLSEVCHILNSIVKQQKQINWLKQCQGKWCSQEGQQQLINQAFGYRGIDPTSSFLSMDDSLLNVKHSELPSLIKTVFTYDQESVKAQPQSLQRLIWLGLQWDLRLDGVLPDLGQFLQPIFPRLLFSTQRLENTSVDNIRLLDIEAFLYCCVHVAKTQQGAKGQGSQSLPQTLPLGLCRGLCSQQQLDWYSALYCLYTAKASSNERAKLRLTVQRGLEVIRCRMNHGMETSLLIRLGRSFRERMQEVKKISAGDENREQWNAFQQMSVMYWQAALEHLQLLARNQAVPTQQKPFFPYSAKLIQESEIQAYQDDGTVAVAECKFQQGQFQQAVTMLDKVKSAEGLFLKAQMYLTKSQMESKELDVSLNCSLLSRQGDLLDKAKCALFDTMDSIQHQPDHPLHEEVQKNLKEIDEQQAALAVKIADLEEEQEAACDNSLNALDTSRNISTISDIAPLQPSGNDPSPRRLAAELRSMNVSHGRLMEENTQLRGLAATHSRILEQNQMLIEKQNLLMESNNALMKQVLDLNTKFQELSTAQAKAPPPPPPPPQDLPGTINSNRPIIISATECKFDSPNLSAQLGASMHPMMSHSMASPMHAGPAQMYHPVYGYYTMPPQQGYGMGAYENAGLHPSLITSTPAMHPGQVPNAQQYLYEDITSPTENEALGMVGERLVQGQASTMPEMQPTTPQAANSYLGSEHGIQPLATRANGSIQPREPLANTLFKNDASPAQTRKETQQPALTGGAKLPFASHPDTAGQKVASQASGQDTSSNSPLLMDMLMQPNKADDPGAGVGGSITAGTPPHSAGAPPSSTSSHHGLFSDKQSSQLGGPIQQTTSSQDAASVFGTASNETSASSSAPFSKFNLNPSQSASQGFFKATSSPVTPDVTASSSLAGAPFSGFSFGQIKAPESTPALSFGSMPQQVSDSKDDGVVPVTQEFTASSSSAAAPFSGFSFGQIKAPESKPALSFGSIPQQVSKSKTEEDDDVIFISETLPTADQRARAEKLLLPPTFFLYEDDPPCPGCRGCEEEDLAQREIKLSKLPNKESAPAASAAVTPAAVFGSAASSTPAAVFGGAASSTPAAVFGGGASSTPAAVFGGAASSTPAAVFGGAASSTPAAMFGSAASGQKTFGSLAVDTPSTFGAKDTSQEEPSIFGNKGSGVSFASITSDNQGTFAGKGAKGFAFAQAGAQVFGGGGDDNAGGDEEHDPHFDPIVPLPELVDTKTGEEDEEIMYKQRARLYRYAKELNVWKERGIGEVKLMRHKDSGGLRLLMRREQVLKLCANHRITDDIKLESLKSSDRTWVWHALDYSEDEPCHEQFAIKFKTPELAAEFRRRFEELQAERKREVEAEKADEAVVPEGPRGDQPEEKDDDGDKKDGKDDTAAEATETGPTTEELIAKYQPKPGSWQCDGCWLNNEETATTCISCTAPKPGAAAPSATQKLSTLSKLAGASRQNESSATTSSGSEFKFGPGGGFSFGGLQTSDGASKPTGFASFGPPSTFSTTPSGTGPFGGGPVQFGTSSSSDTVLMAPKEKQVATPTSKFTFGSGFQKYDLGAAGDQPNQPVVASTSPSAGFTFGATKLTPPKSEPVAAAPSTVAPSTDVPSSAAPSTAAPSTAAPSTSQPQSLTPVKPKDKQKEVPPTKEGTGFVFGAAGGLLAQTPKSSAAPASSKPAEEKSMGFNFAAMAKTKGSLFSFRMDVSKTPQEAPEKSPVKPKSPGVVVKSPQQQPPSPGLNKSGDDYYKDDDGDHIHFDPIVELPECIEARTGEEGEEVRFSHRAKLFRYNKESAQWKERGLGDIKVLYNPDTKKYRIVMRREQVLKVCANHFVTPDLKLQPMAGSTKSLVWMAMDASEDEVQMEQLAVKFKTEELAQQFKEAVEAAQEDMKMGGGGGDAVKKEAEKENQDVEGDVKEEDDGETDEEDDEGAEEDEEDYEDVDDDDEDEYEDDGEEEEGEEGGNGDGEEEQDATEQGEDEQNTPTQGGEEQEDATTQGDDESPTVKSCDPNISKAFSELLRNANASHAQKQKEMSEAESSPKDEEAAGSSKDDSVTEERDDIHFDPIVQLPEQLEKITGEEDENQLFCSRAKLYRYDKTSSQWKDRGVGDIKILQNVKTRRYRILMRRDQVFRVCANHYITKDMALLPNAGSENSLVWRAMDASDGEPQPEQLAVRFKLAGTTQRFKVTFEECQADLRKLEDDNKGSEQGDEVSSTTEESSKSPSKGQDAGDVDADKKPSTATSSAKETDTTPSSSTAAGTTNQGSN